MKPIASPQYLPGRRTHDSGVALVIVLAFVVIITGVILAFFSQSLFTRQISDASASQTRADLLAQGASESIVADLQQEILLTSSTTTYPIGTGTTGVIYTPSSPQYMLPQLSGTDRIAGVTWAPNFLGRSGAGDLFFTGSNATIPTSGSSNVIAVSSTTPSLNGRTVSLTSWNAHYLLPLSSTSADSTPYITSTSYFQAPDWVLITRSGSSPGSWVNSLANPAISNSNYVVGRYAYAIYHEGGLLDANIAGYPEGTSNTTNVTQIGDKPALAYADLTQLPGGFNNNQSQVDQFVAWRNYASALVTGSQVGGLSFAPPGATTAGSNYYNFVVNNPNPTGFLSVGSAGLNQGQGSTSGATSGQSDRMFGSRQELIAFLQNGLGMTGPNLQALNYLATFTRGLNQPTVAPPPNRPKISNPPANGGNNAQNLDSELNPSFLSVRVSGTTFLRNDGSIAEIGEPLVKKRFALSKLAWLTYLGPSANRVIPTTNPGQTSPNYDMWQLVHTYGVSPTYLAQGTWQNIAKYFGLHWLPDPIPPLTGRSALPASFHDSEYKWFYEGHNELGASASGTSVASSVTISNTYGAISRIEDIAAADALASTGTNAREPDFFELLKASVIAGSKAKGLFNGGVAPLSGAPTNPYSYQNTLDTSLDYAIIQLGANIIDQAKPDGYATRIVFDDSSQVPREFRGVENLPYLYRVNAGVLKLRAEAGLLNSSGTAEEDTAPATPSVNFTDTGLGLVMDIPTVWNPTDINAPLGIPGPAGGPGVVPQSLLSGGNNVRLIADSIIPTNLVSVITNASQASNNYESFIATTQNNQYYSYLQTTGAQYKANLAAYTTGPNGSGSPITPTMTEYTASSTTTGTLPTINANNTQLTFVIPDSTYFREPTVLAMAGKPSNSGLTMGTAPTAIPQYALLQNSSGKPAFVNTSGTAGFLSDPINPNPLNLPSPPPASQAYVGIPLALVPVVFAGPALHTGTMGVYPGYDITLNYYGNNLGDYLDYRMQYKDPNTSPTVFVSGAQFEQGSGYDSGANLWETYDEKYNTVETLFLSAPYNNVKADAGNLLDQFNGSEGANWESYADPRTSRFGAVFGRDLEPPVQTPGGQDPTLEWADPANGIIHTDRPDTNSGYAVSDDRVPVNTYPELYQFTASGWTIGNGHFRVGLISQNNRLIGDNAIRYNGDTAKSNPPPSPEGPTYYTDPDGVMRGAMGYYVAGASANPANTTVGLPLATAFPSPANRINQPSAQTSNTPYQGQSRPYFLHRPYRSVGELGYVFSGTPWKNIDFFTPQSGDSGLLDVFTATETPPAPAGVNPMVAGVVNLNTRQAPVLQAILSGASVDEVQTSLTGSTGFPPLTAQQANQIVSGQQGLLAFTAPTNPTTGQGPLENMSQLVGGWDGSAGAYLDTGYGGLSSYLSNLYSSIYGSSTSGLTVQNIDRFRETVLRPLSAVGNTRVWNLLIDVVAQSGRYPTGTSSAANFVVDGQQRYWVHVAIDRYTGQVLDKQVEVVKQ